MRSGSYPNWLKFVIVLAAVAATFGCLNRSRSGPEGASVVRADTVGTPAWVKPLLGGPLLFGCPVFPGDNVWNTTIDNLPKAANSDAYIQTMGADKPLHPDFGANGGIPFAVVPPGTKRVRVVFDYSDQSDLGNYPIPPNAPIEGGPNSDGDRHVILVEPKLCMLYEIYGARPQPDGSWKAGSGIKMDLTDNALRPDGYTSGDAAGLPILPGLVRYDEVASGVIRHALRFTVPQTQAAHIWPARHDASRLKGANYPPMGVRLRLRANFDITPFSKTNQVILTALKHYGMILADNGAPFFISGAPDRRWNDDDLHHLNGVRGSDFEVVDEGDLQMEGNSARVDPISAH